MDKKTIFLLPLDLKEKRQTRITPKFIREVYNLEKKNILPASLQKKKNNIFTIELNRLIGKISDKNKTHIIQEEATPTDISEIDTPNPVSQESIVPKKPNMPPSIPDDFDILNKIYSNVSQEENTIYFLERLFSSLGIKAYSFFYYEPHTFTYYPIFCQGLSDKAQTNLLFQSKDKFLQNLSAGYIHLFFQPVLVNDVFFKKKLSPLDFANYSSLVLKFFNAYNLPGLVAIFYEKDTNPSLEDIEKLSQDIDVKIKPLVPYLNSYFQLKVNAKLDSNDILRKIIQAIRIQSKKLEERFYFTKLKFLNFLTVEDAVAKKKSIILLLRNHLLKEEGLIDMNFNELILLTKENEVEKIINYISENTKTEFQFQINSLKYPENGKNLYLYF